MTTTLVANANYLQLWTPLPATNRAGRIAAILVDATCRFVSLLSSAPRDADLIRQQRRPPGAPIATVKF